MDVEFRQYTKGDFLSLSTLSDDEWKVTHIGVAKNMYQTTGNIEQCFVAICENKLVGYIYGFVLPNGTLIPEFLYVLPTYRKLGIGAALLSELERASGCAVSMIFYNSSLHQYYKKLGYEAGNNLEVAMKNIPSAKE